jgi:hypothetical protein
MGDSDDPKDTLDAIASDEIKLVRYWITFTKPDLEAVLDQGEELLLSTTTPESFASLKFTEFIARLERGAVPLPTLWAARHYPPKAAGKNAGALPRQDRRYLTFQVEVVRRISGSASECEAEGTRT